MGDGETTKCPLLGRLHCVKDIYGSIQISIIVAYWMYGNFTTYTIVLLPQYYDGNVSAIFLSIYGFISANTIISLYIASSSHPGRVPLPHEVANQDTSNWEFCDKCNRHRPDRAHHCRRCGHCVTKMDHHCPWINNCVGQDNLWAFLTLLFFAFSMSFLTFLVDILYFFVYPDCKACDKSSLPQAHQRLFIWIQIVLSTLTSICLCTLWCNISFLMLFDSYAQTHVSGLMGANVVMSVLMMIGSSMLCLGQTCNLVFASLPQLYQHVLMWVAGVMAVLMMGTMFAMYGGQHCNLLFDRTTLDNLKNPHWAYHEKPVFKKTCSQAYYETCGPGPCWWYLFPCRRRRVAILPAYTDVV